MRTIVSTPDVSVSGRGVTVGIRARAYRELGARIDLVYRQSRHESSRVFICIVFIKLIMCSSKPILKISISNHYIYNI
jgi:hypothetical protein